MLYDFWCEQVAEKLLLLIEFLIKHVAAALLTELDLEIVAVKNTARLSCGEKNAEKTVAVAAKSEKVDSVD